MVAGPTLIHVGERPRGQKKYASDEYVLAPPGTIVAPRKRGEKPTPENAARAIIGQAEKMGLLGGEPMSKGPAAYDAYTKAKGMAQTPARRMPLAAGGASVGPPVYRRLTPAAVGAGVTSTAAPTAAASVGQPTAAANPFKDALDAIFQVGQAQGVDPTAAAGMLLNQPTPASPAPSTIPFASGAGSMSNYLGQLIQGGQLTGPDLMLAQLAIMLGMGQINPAALGITDPAQFREILAGGGGVPTLDAQKQRFNESLFGFSQSAPSRGNVPAVASS